jgi:hypothetical protein
MLELRPVGLLVVHPLIVGEHVVGALLLGVGEADARPSASQIETARALAIAGSAEAMGVGWVGGPSPAWPARGRGAGVAREREGRRCASAAY